MKRLITAMLTAAMVMAPVVSYALPAPQGLLNNCYGAVALSTEGPDGTILHFFNTVSPGDKIYYRVVSSDRFYCKSLKIYAKSAGNNAFYMPEGEPVIEAKYGVRGDANDDGALNISDVAMVLRYLADHGDAKKSIVKNGADFNRDGKVNLSDASVIMRKIAYFDVGGNISSDIGYSVTYLPGAVIK